MTDDGRGDLPPGWAWTTLGQITDINPRRWDCPPSDADLISFVPMASVEAESGHINASVTKPYSEVRKGYTPFQEHDILFAKITPCMENGKFAVARGLHNGRAVGSTEFHILRPPPEIDPHLLLNFLFQSDIRRAARAVMGGAVGQQRVPAQFLEGLKLPLPPLPEQRRIVAAIEEQFTRLDAAVAALERARANLKRYRAAVLAAACSGRLVPTEAALARAEGRDYEPAERLLARILAERRAAPRKGSVRRARDEPAPPDTAGLPELPEGWCWASPEQLSSADPYSIGIGPFGSNLKTSDYTESGVPLVFVRNIRSRQFGGEATRFVSLKKSVELRPHWVEPGDLLVTKMGDPPGDACLYPLTEPVGILTADCIKVRLHQEISSKYVAHTVNSMVVKPQILGITKGVAQLKVSLARFKTVGIPLPPLAEQQRIVAEVERRLSVVEEQERAVERALARAATLRQAILRRAFAGKLVPQDPRDEPASVLLERIRQERAAAGDTARPRRGRAKEKTATAAKQGRLFEG